MIAIKTAKWKENPSCGQKWQEKWLFSGQMCLNFLFFSYRCMTDSTATFPLFFFHFVPENITKASQAKIIIYWSEIIFFAKARITVPDW